MKWLVQVPEPRRAGLFRVESGLAASGISQINESRDHLSS